LAVAVGWVRPSLVLMGVLSSSSSFVRFCLSPRGCGIPLSVGLSWLIILLLRYVPSWRGTARTQSAWPPLPFGGAHVLPAKAWEHLEGRRRSVTFPACGGNLRSVVPKDSSTHTCPSAALSLSLCLSARPALCFVLDFADVVVDDVVASRSFFDAQAAQMHARMAGLLCCCRVLLGRLRRTSRGDSRRSAVWLRVILYLLGSGWEGLTRRRGPARGCINRHVDCSIRSMRETIFFFFNYREAAAVSSIK
jgi:hypothetical protein